MRTAQRAVGALRTPQFCSNARITRTKARRKRRAKHKTALKSILFKQYCLLLPECETCKY